METQAKSIGAYVTKENMESTDVWIGLRRNVGSSVVQPNAGPVIEGVSSLRERILFLNGVTNVMVLKPLVQWDLLGVNLPAVWYISWKTDHWWFRGFFSQTGSAFEGLKMLLITCFIFGLLGTLTWADPKARTACPFGSFALRERSQWYCYKFYEERFTFQEAEEDCQFKCKGHLASFISDSQAKSVNAYVSKGNREKRWVWIGLQRLPKSDLNNGWRWNDGTRSRYTRWGPGEPNNMSRNEFCVALSPQSEHLKWVDINCSSKLPFLCKWSPA
ncbi:lithostathine-1-alpha-like isoform X2 [Erythrolamprus reginae]|uniref:lithostathine-1-alpha-like isoform X2 n=1 Tax=Erythrolamprus reginae TaxID=121349 RepID=UPI00396CE543